MPLEFVTLVVLPGCFAGLLGDEKAIKYVFEVVFEENRCLIWMSLRGYRYYRRPWPGAKPRKTSQRPNARNKFFSKVVIAEGQLHRSYRLAG